MKANQPQSSTAEAITTPLAVGDKVSYVAISGGGRTTKQPLSKLTPDGQPNALTRMLMEGQ
ncbi:hypothetical protein [Pseudomonas sp. S2_E01]